MPPLAHKSQDTQCAYHQARHRSDWQRAHHKARHRSDWQRAHHKARHRSDWQRAHHKLCKTGKTNSMHTPQFTQPDIIYGLTTWASHNSTFCNSPCLCQHLRSPINPFLTLILQLGAQMHSTWLGLPGSGIPGLVWIQFHTEARSRHAAYCYGHVNFQYISM